MMVQLVETVAEARRKVAGVRRSGASIGFVPTMGALHAGHGRLIEQARKECPYVVVSIFVNPIQFDRKDDFERYPRALDADLAFCDARGVDLVFAPTAEEMYPSAPRAFVDVNGLTDHLCGRTRPGHFRGVATVVSKLFHIVGPAHAYFGEKDWQQLAVIRRMVRDLNLPVEIVGVPTFREEDGLALSSRNKHLTPEQRSVATVLYRALMAAEERVRAGETDPEAVRRAALSLLEQQPDVRVDYLEVVHPEDIQPVERINGPALVAGAVWLGSTRLIDNMLCQPGAGK